MKNITNHRFGKLTAVQATTERKHGQIIWRCVCDCGKELNVASSPLTTGKTKSCGCLRHDRGRLLGSCKKVIEFNGMRATVAEWLEEAGITFEEFQKRLKNGMSETEALTTPKSS